MWTITPVAFSTRRSDGPPGGGQPVADARREIARLAARADLAPRLGEHRARGVDAERVVGRAGQLVDRRQIAQLHA